MSGLLIAGLRPALRAAVPAAVLLSPFLVHQIISKRPLLCDAKAASGPIFGGSHSNGAKVPIFRDGKLNPDAVGQLSTGSVLGLLGGLAIGFFSKTIAFCVGTGIFLIQWLASKGYHIIPYDTLQRYAKSVNVQSFFEDNIAFKLSFGATFALASFASI